MSDLITVMAGAAGAGGAETDEYFNQTTLLLHGDGTNGAQNNTFLDSSTNNFTITRNGNTTQGSFSPFSNADGEWSNYFDGTGDYLTTTAVDFTGDFTIECWYLQTAIDASGYTILFGRTSQDIALEIGRNTAASIGISFGGSNVILAAGTAVTNNVYHHLAWVREGTTCRVYVDGVQQGTGTKSGTLSLDTIGRYGFGGYEANGYVSNVRWVNGTCLYPSGTSFTPSTTPLDDNPSNTVLLTCQSNRFVDNNTQVTAKTITPNGNVAVQPFSPFAPSAAYSPSVNGGSGYFDGTSDNLSVANNAAFQFGTGDFTVEAWVYQTVQRAEAQVIVKCAADQTWNTGWTLSLGTSNSVVSFWVNGSSVSTSGASTVTLNGWSHVAVSRSGTTLKMFINGVEVDSDTNSTSIVPTVALTVGADITSSTYEFQGYLSNVRVVKGTALYTSAFTPPTAPLTAVSGTSLLCNFTNAGIFDNTGKNDLETVGNAQIDTTTKKYGTGSMEFDGTGDYLFARHTPEWLLGSGDFTVEFWLNMDSGTSTAGVIAPAAYADTTGTWSVILDSNTLYWQGYTGLTNLVSASYTSYKGAWTHVAFVKSSGTTTIYLNGTSSGSASDSNTYSTAPATGWTIGYQARNNYYLTGYIDDLRITKGVARYTTTFTPPDKAFPDL